MQRLNYLIFAGVAGAMFLYGPRALAMNYSRLRSITSEETPGRNAPQEGPLDTPRDLAVIAREENIKRRQDKESKIVGDKNGSPKHMNVGTRYIRGL